MKEENWWLIFNLNGDTDENNIDAQHLDCDDDFMSDQKISKLFKLYSVNMCHLISVYSSIKTFKNVNTVYMCA